MTLQTVDSLELAQTLVRNRDHAQERIEAHLSPYLTMYKEFLIELNPSYDSRDLTADIFEEIDTETFSFTGEEVYQYHEYYTPSLSLPFAFVENPILFKEAERAAEADRKAKVAAKDRITKDQRIARLEAQLAKARAEA